MERSFFTLQPSYIPLIYLHPTHLPTSHSSRTRHVKSSWMWFIYSHNHLYTKPCKLAPNVNQWQDRLIPRTARRVFWEASNMNFVSSGQANKQEFLNMLTKVKPWHIITHTIMITLINRCSLLTPNNSYHYDDKTQQIRKFNKHK